MQDITYQYRAVTAQHNWEKGLAKANKEKSIRFKATLSLLICFFLWIALLHALGLYFFTKGFLLTRLVLDDQSKCESPPIQTSTYALGSYEKGCWHPKVFDKAVIIIIDALRYDFTVPFHGDDPHHFHNNLHVLYEAATQTPQSAFLLPFIADPPTTTLQRLKGLTTGTLPTFIDAGSNFAGTAIEEDNLLAQLRHAGKTLVHLGDDTWHSLFPGYFDANLTHAYDSLNVWDLHTVDNGVTEHLMPLLTAKQESRWDVIVGHYLGVDHAGHRYGPDHPATKAKLQEMDQTIREIVARLDDQTLLVVMGDHGMDVKGDHGGESDDEVEAALWMYSKKGIFGRGHNGLTKPPATAKERPVGQIDLVPTLSLLLGMPIPYNNLGAPISEAFVGPGDPDWQTLATVNALAAAQINNYQNAYSRARGLDDSIFAPPRQAWDNGQYLWQATRRIGESEKYEDIFNSFSEYQQETLKICRSLWARFDVPSMVQGIALLASSLAILAFFSRSSGMAGPASAATYLGHMSIVGCITFLGAIITHWLLSGARPLNAGLQGLGFGSIVGFIIALFRSQWKKPIPLPSSLWGWLAFIVTISQSIGFASNSYTIWEDEILFFFLSTFAMMALISSIRQDSLADRNLGVAQSITFGLLTLLASFSRLCREEQMPYCRSTYYASSTSSTSAPWQLVIPLLTATFLPLAIRVYYQQTGSYEGTATVWIDFLLRFGLVASATFWILDAADDNDWLLSHDKSKLKMIKIVISRLVLGISFVVGTAFFVRSQPCITVKVAPGSDGNDKVAAGPKSVQIYGSSNIHGTRYYLLVTSLLVGLALMQKPMGNGALAIFSVQILSLLEILSNNNLSQSAIGPIILAALGNFHFFKTGHQATLSSIQWESAFIPLTTIKYPFSPILVILNTFGAQIMSAAAVPLLAIWKQAPKKTGLLGAVANALATFLLYHATITLATTMWAGHLRRHLMLYRIFSPRFMTAAVVLLVVDLIGTLIALGAFWFNLSSIAEVFGWP
ncbi:MAG: hypothetical protein Q9163_000665 [Psora crenata]